MDLFLPSKETLPGKETSEVDAELHPVNWYHPTYRLRLPFLYRSQHVRTARDPIQVATEVSQIVIGHRVGQPCPPPEDLHAECFSQRRLDSAHGMTAINRTPSSGARATSATRRSAPSLSGESRTKGVSG